MPFTFAHPAAVVPLAPPLARWLGTHGVLSALVVGSMTPDIAFLLPIGISRAQSHSLPGLLWCCLPVGLFVYLGFHLLLKRPLIHLLPPHGFARLHQYEHPGEAVSWRLLPAILLCLLIGAITHLVWDSFTHKGSYGVQALPVLRMHLFTGGGFWIYLYTALQWISSIIGLGLLARWAWRWLQATPAFEGAPVSTVSRTQRYAVMGFVVCLSLAMGMSEIYSDLFPRVTASSQELVNRGLLGAVAGFGVALCLYSLGWHLSRGSQR
jgi:Domain of unknown function (DUF4184)